MYVVRSPRGTFLRDEGLRDDRFAAWTFKRERALIVTRAEYDEMREEWAYLDGCDLLPAVKGVRVA